ncbi:J domain-containing protein [Miltoncostaea marina]|uniref:J domain-containing protein n=1 Tax=Miltoncostaea marina TaxID=2843215 RepID=UPI001C3C39BA|nr:J domain-containing protein [Miltoncostaea marina]
MSEPDDHYAALDVAPDAGAREIRDAWRFRIAAFHPDRFRDAAQRERAQEITKRVNAAWHVLGDPARRSRYDARRTRRARARTEPAGPPPRPRRELPCPTCASRCRVDDAGGAVVELACPACGARFPAMIGAYCLGRPRLQRRWLGLRYEAVFADAAGGRRSVSFRSLPPELALSEGELFSVVFDARTGRPAYAIVHGTGLDMAWRVR